ncbi:MAG: hypothetical protein MUE41_16080 [Gemmatimonadaceae bacterium]|nr:hypothetical protein [Gemmatimonadaceae bacterium]
MRTPTEIATRVEVIKRRDAFDRDPAAFLTHWEKEDAKVRRHIVAARRRLAEIAVPDEMLALAATLCQRLGTDGLRGELTLIRAARASAALAGGSHHAVGVEDLRQVATSALRHRMRRNVLDESGATSRVERAVLEVFGEPTHRPRAAVSPA